MTNHSEERRQPREVEFFECDHMRAVVQMNGEWRHIIEDGQVSDHPCGCGYAYRQTAKSTDQHYLTLLTEPRVSGSPTQEETR